MGRSVEEWVLFGTLLQLLITLPYWIWRVGREWEVWRAPRAAWQWLKRWGGP